jgi:hypothetical protein
LRFAKYRLSTLDLHGAAVKFHFGAMGYAVIPAVDIRNLLPGCHWITLISTFGKAEQDHEHGDVA